MSGEGRSRTLAAVEEEHPREWCDCNDGLCSHGSFCGGDEAHGYPEVLPEWPCAAVLAVTGDASAEAYWQRIGDEWVAAAQAEHPEWFTTDDAKPVSS